MRRRETEIDEIMLNQSRFPRTLVKSIQAKDANDVYKNISITHDYTIEERAEIKSISESAKAKIICGYIYRTQS